MKKSKETVIKPIEPMNDHYNNLEIRWIKEKINELVEVVNAIIAAQGEV